MIPFLQLSSQSMDLAASTWRLASYIGRLFGFEYREIVRRLKLHGFEFDRYAKGSHEIWINSETILFLVKPPNQIIRDPDPSCVDRSIPPRRRVWYPASERLYAVLR